MDRQAVNINTRSPPVLQPEKRCALKILGICEVIFGSGCVTFGFVFLFADYSISYYGAGIWCGILIVTAGSLGIASGSPATIWCLVNLHTGFSMFGCVAAALLAYLSCASMLSWLSGEYRWEIILHGLNVFFSFISCILLIVSASICCCCPSPLGYCGTCSQEYENDEEQHEEYELQNRSTGFT
ncbi:unnamed protein product [Clavelina lepadiformis]|uniref:Uncharacterized protein n=1 Tax=Clavelina lepadiformis TaxID=159417 RepID=A0ABP0GKK0_CLALP